MSKHSHIWPMSGRHLGALAAICLLAACAPNTASRPDAIELANIKPKNVVPKSSSSQLVRAFRRYCMALTPMASRTALRASDYVQARDRRGVETWLTDNRNPAVLLNETSGGVGCAVAATARTGQTDRIVRYIQTILPTPKEIAPSSIGPRTERAWADAEGRIYFLNRQGPRTAPPRILFGTFRPGAAP